MRAHGHVATVVGVAEEEAAGQQDLIIDWIRDEREGKELRNSGRICVYLR